MRSTGGTAGSSGAGPSNERPRTGPVASRAAWTPPAKVIDRARRYKVDAMEKMETGVSKDDLIAELRKVVSDPAGEAFIRDDEANRMRTRAKRAPWHA